MKVTAFVKNPEHVCCRYRLAGFVPLWRRAGHQLAFRSCSGQWLSAGFLRQAVGDAEVVIVQRKLFSGSELAALRRAAPVLVFDFDDAVFVRNSFSSRGLYSASRARDFEAMVRAADAVVAGNAFLAEQAARWTEARRIHTIPTCLDPGRYPLAGHTRRGQDVQLVWIGSGSTLQGLEQVRPFFERLGRLRPGLALKIICDRFPAFDHVRVLMCRWSMAREGDELADADIGISWLPDDLWSRGKCGLKVLQYMAAGLPVVANPVGVQATLVRHGETGFLARTPDEWASAIACLSEDPALRCRMGRAGRRRVEEEFNVSAGAQRWLGVLNQSREAYAIA